MRENLRRGAAALVAMLRVAAGAMLVASVGINFANIIGRYFFRVSLTWAEEAMLFLMIGCVFLGAGPVGWMGRHIRMDVVVSLLPPRMRQAFEIFSDQESVDIIEKIIGVLHRHLKILYPKIIGKLNILIEPIEVQGGMNNTHGLSPAFKRLHDIYATKKVNYHRLCIRRFAIRLSGCLSSSSARSRRWAISPRRS